MFEYNVRHTKTKDWMVYLMDTRKKKKLESERVVAAQEEPWTIKLPCGQTDRLVFSSCVLSFRYFMMFRRAPSSLRYVESFLRFVASLCYIVSSFDSTFCHFDVLFLWLTMQDWKWGTTRCQIPHSVIIFTFVTKKDWIVLVQWSLNAFGKKW